MKEGRPRSAPFLAHELQWGRDATISRISRTARTARSALPNCPGQRSTSRIMGGREFRPASGVCLYPVGGREDGDTGGCGVFAVGVGRQPFGLLGVPQTPFWAQTDSGPHNTTYQVNWRTTLDNVPHAPTSQSGSAYRGLDAKRASEASVAGSTMFRLERGGASSQRALALALGGWQANIAVSFQGGFPLTPGESYNSAVPALYATGTQAGSRPVRRRLPHARSICTSDRPGPDRLIPARRALPRPTGSRATPATPPGASRHLCSAAVVPSRCADPAPGGLFQTLRPKPAVLAVGPGRLRMPAAIGPKP